MKAWHTLWPIGGGGSRHWLLGTKSLVAAYSSFVIHQHSLLSNPPAAPFGLLYGLIGLMCLLLCARIMRNFVQLSRSHMHRLGPVLYPLDVRHVETCREALAASSDCEIGQTFNITLCYHQLSERLADPIVHLTFHNDYLSP